MKNTLFVPKQKTPHFHLPSHTITWKQDLSHLKQTFSKADLEVFLRLYSLANNNPKKSRKDIEIFRKKHPDHPEVLNLLTFVYLSCRKVRKANRLIRENYAKNPDYLFAKINFADLCLREKKIDLVPDIFNKKLNLRSLYPKRKIFHISEFRGFMVLMGLYYLSLGKREIAEGYHYLVKRIDPDHPGTKMLQKKLYQPSFWHRFKLIWKKP